MYTANTVKHRNLKELSQPIFRLEAVEEIVDQSHPPFVHFAVILEHKRMVKAVGGRISGLGILIEHMSN